MTQDQANQQQFVEDDSGNPQYLNWDKPKREAFREAYTKATREGLPQFNWRGHDFVTAYAKYLLEFLDHSLPA